MKFSKPFCLALLAMFCAVVACVTVNIYFPAEKVESVAGEIVHDIRGPAGGEKNKPVKDGNSSLLRGTFLALSPSVVWAEEATTS